MKRLLTKLSKIDISRFEEAAHKLIDSCSIEGLYVDENKGLLYGDFYDQIEINSSLCLKAKGYSSYCSKCGLGLCSHISALIISYLKDSSGFELVGHRGLSAKVTVKFTPYEFSSSKQRSRKPLTKKFKKMIDGIDFSFELLNEILKSGFSGNDLIFNSRIKAQLNKLDAYYLGGLKIEFQALLQKISISQVNNESLGHLDYLYRVLKQGRKEFHSALEKGLCYMPNSIITTILGHVWKYEDLLHWNKPRDSQLIQLHFDVQENLAAQRLEENSIWLDLSNGKVYLSQNLRPFKALRFIPAENTEYDLLACVGLVEYPGEYNCRVRWRDSERQELKSCHIKAAFEKALSFTKEELKTIKAELRDELSLISPHRFYKVDKFFIEGKRVSVSMNGFSFELQDSYHTRVLNTFSSCELEGVACLFKFGLDRGSDVFTLAPLCIVSEKSIDRLGF